MNFFNFIFPVLVTLIAIGCVFITFKWIPAQTVQGHFGTIDGMRGYLAFFVFLHHASVWQVYSTTGVWTSPASHLFTHLGQSSVAIFFMITSFLFYNKVLACEHKEYNLRSFFIGRFFRLMPLYAVVMIIVFLLVALVSKGILHDKPLDLFFNAMSWLSFTILGAPAINQVDSFRIVAGVTWSLPYEWFFYLTLPLISVAAGQHPRWHVLASSIAAFATAWFAHLAFQLIFIFAGGMIAAQLVRNEKFLLLAKKPLASAVVVACIIAVLQFETAYAILPLAFLTISFCLIAGGSDLFGGLVTKTSRRFGELAYSIYLIHGILLYVAINLIIGKNNIAEMSSIIYWAIIGALVPLLLAVSTLTFHHVEQPGIALGRKIAMLRSGN